MKNLHYDEKTAHADTLGQDALFDMLSLTPHVRGGSVSRRGHNQLTGSRSYSQAEPPLKK